MRLLVDAQCVQSTSSLRGIGRYALCLTRALVEQAGPHRVEVLLNGGDDPERLLRARHAMESFLPAGRVHVFDAPWPWDPPHDRARRPAAEAAYSAAVRSLRPDALLVLSPFEGDNENVLSIQDGPHDPPAAAVLFDLIPALQPGTYLLGPGAADYWRRLEDVARCSALLSISSYSGAQAGEVLQERCPPVSPVWGGPFPSGDFPSFEQLHDDRPDVRLPSDYLLAVGGDHPRKNLDRLVTAWGRVPREVRVRHPLVLACRLNTGTVRRLQRTARRHGVTAGELVLTGGVAERTLKDLYAGARAFVFPSTEEGLGMPPLEAMAAGCPTVLARGSSLDELCDDDDAYFDGLDVDAIARALERVLSDQALRSRLRAAGARTSERFTWSRSARLAWTALEALPAANPAVTAPPRVVALSDPTAEQQMGQAPAALLLDEEPVDETAAGVLGLPVAFRAAAAMASALLAPSPSAAAAAIRAGALDAPVLLDRGALQQVAAHDFYGAYSIALAGLDLEEGLARSVVQAVDRPPRWTLERPRPVWLLVTPDGGPLPDVQHLLDGVGVDLVVARTAGAGLGSSADALLVRAEDVDLVTPAMREARRRGAHVVVLRREGAATPVGPSWCADAVLDGPLDDPRSWDRGLAERVEAWDRTTGWPWRGKT